MRDPGVAAEHETGVCDQGGELGQAGHRQSGGGQSGALGHPYTQSCSDAEPVSTTRCPASRSFQAALALAETGAQPTMAKRKKAVAHAMKEVADRLGNTPAVAGRRMWIHA